MCRYVMFHLCAKFHFSSPSSYLVTPIIPQRYESAPIVEK